jgi:hypothetical protein
MGWSVERTEHFFGENTASPYQAVARMPLKGHEDVSCSSVLAQRQHIDLNCMGSGAEFSLGLEQALN